MVTARGPEEEGKKAREERGEELATTVAKLLNATDRPLWICHFGEPYHTSSDDTSLPKRHERSLPRARDVSGARGSNKVHTVVVKAAVSRRVERLEVDGDPLLECIDRDAGAHGGCLHELQHLRSVEIAPEGER
jgi:hypothetical protein